MHLPAGGVASRIIRAGGVHGLRANEGEPGDVVEELIHLFSVCGNSGYHISFKWTQKINRYTVP